MNLEFNREELEAIRDMTASKTPEYASKGADMEYIAMLVDIYKKCKQALVTEAVETVKPKKKSVGAPRGDRMLLHCYECDDYLSGCAGALKQVCKYNDELREIN